MAMKDLGLSYEEALHGVQSAVKYELENGGLDAEFAKHLRVGIDARASDARGLVELLIAKGVFTGEEYVEYVRLAMNEELVRYTSHVRKRYGLPDNVEFR